MRIEKARGFTIVELLVSLAVFSMAMASISGLLVQNSKINKAQQMTSDMQADARNCLSMIVQRLRTAGWDPLNNGFSPLVLDADPTDSVSYIEVFADLEEDGDTDDPDEAVLIRHTGDRIEWRRTTSGPYEVLAVDISNDADGDGNPEPMFVPDSTTNPTQITVRITAQSPVPDPSSGNYIRYTMSSVVFLRKNL